MNLSESYSKKADSILTSSKQKPENTLLKDYENYDLLSRTLSADIKPVFTGLNLAPAGVIVDSIIQRAADERTRANNDSSYVPTTEVIIGVGTAGAGKTDFLGKVDTMAKIRGITVGKGNWEGPQSKHPDKSLYQGYWPLIEINKMAYEEIIPAIRNNSLVGIEFPASAATYDEYGMLAGRPLGHLALVNIIDDINRTNEDPEKLAARVNMFCLSPGLSLLYLANQFRKQGAPSEVIDTHRFFQRKRARELFEQGSVEGIQPYIVDMVLKDSKVNPMKYQEFNKIYGDYIDSMLGYLLSLDRETYTKSPKLHNLRGMRTISEQKRVLSRELVTSLAGSYVMWHFAIHDLGLSWEDTFHGLVDPPPEKFLGTNRLPASYVKSMMYPTDGYPEEYIPPHKLVDDMVIQHSSRKVKKNSGRWQ